MIDNAIHSLTIQSERVDHGRYFLCAISLYLVFSNLLFRRILLIVITCETQGTIQVNHKAISNWLMQLNASVSEYFYTYHLICERNDVSLQLMEYLTSKRISSTNIKNISLPET